MRVWARYRGGRKRKEGQRYCLRLEIQERSPWTLRLPTADSAWPPATYRCGYACDLTQSSLGAGRSVDPTADMQTHRPGYLWSWEGFLVQLSCLQNTACCFPTRSLQAWPDARGRELHSGHLSRTGAFPSGAALAEGRTPAGLRELLHLPSRPEPRQSLSAWGQVGLSQRRPGEPPSWGLCPARTPPALERVLCKDSSGASPSRRGSEVEC